MIEKQNVSRKLGAFFAVVLLVGCMGVLAGCSSGKQSSSTSAPATSSASEESAAPDYVGGWDIVKMTADGKTLDSDTLDGFRRQGADFFININEDKTFVMCVIDESNLVKGTWSPSEDGSLVLKSDQGQTSVMLIEGDEASIGKLFFKYSGPAKSIPKKIEKLSGSTSSSDETAPADTNEAEASSDLGEVSSDVKEALDSYEAFMDEYVAFMEKYKQNSSDLSLLSEYSDFLQKYTDFSQKINAMDTSSMSSADYAYYIEVTGRVSKKLLDTSL